MITFGDINDIATIISIIVILLIMCISCMMRIYNCREQPHNIATVGIPFVPLELRTV